MTIGTPTVIAANGSNVSQSVYQTGSIPWTAGRHEEVLICSRRSDGAAAAPTALAGLGMAWTKKDEYNISNNNQVWSLWQGVEGGSTGGITPITGFGTSTNSVGDPDTSGTINTASGLVVSRKNTGSGRIFWTHNDNGLSSPTPNPPVAFYAFDETSPFTIIYTALLKDGSGNALPNNDTEDMATGPGPTAGVKYLYMAVTGIQGGDDSQREIYRIPEPTVTPNQTPVTANVTADVFTFTPPVSSIAPGTKDIEAMAIDPRTGDVYLFQKLGGSATRPRSSSVWRAPGSQFVAGGGTVTFTEISVIPTIVSSTNNGGIVAADFSEDGDHLFIKNYEEIWLWNINDGQTVENALDNDTPVYTRYTTSFGAEAAGFDTGSTPGRIYFMSEGATAPLRWISCTPGTPTGGAATPYVTITHASPQISCGWLFTEFPQVDLSARIVGAVKHVRGSGNLSATLDSATAAGDAIVVYTAGNAELEEPAYTGDLVEIGEARFSWGSFMTVSVDMSGGQTVTVNAGGTANKVLFAHALADQPATNTAPGVTVTKNVATPKGGNVVTLTAAGTDSDGSITNYSWNHNAPSSSVDIDGNILTFTVPYSTQDQSYSFTCTVTDDDGATGSDNESFTVAYWPDWIKMPDGTWKPVADGAPSGPPEPPVVTVNAVPGEGQATLSWSIAPNGHNVTGVFEGRSGPGGTPTSAYEVSTMTPGISGSRLFTNLTNGQTYNLYVKPVVDGVTQAAVGVSVTPQGTTPPPPPSGVKLSWYRGNPSESPDADYKTKIGVDPAMASSYYTTQVVNETYERGRIARGSDIFMDFDPKEPANAGYIVDISNYLTAPTNPGSLWAIAKLQAAQRVATSVTTTAKVYVTLAHEWEVKRAKGVWTVAGDADIATYAKALDNMMLMATQYAPNCLFGLWFGGYSDNQSTISQVMNLLTRTPKWLSVDPYINDTASTGGSTFPALWDSYGVDFLQSHPKYATWNSPPIFLTEFGVNTDGPTDATVASKLVDLKTKLSASGISGAIYFNRDRPDEAANHMYALDNGDTPLALAEFKKSVTGSGGGNNDLPTYPSFTLRYVLDTSRNGPWWSWQRGKEHISAGYCGATGTEHVAFDAVNGAQILMRRRSSPITVGGYSLNFDTAEGYLDGDPLAILPNYYRARGIWSMTSFHVGLFPAFGWFRPFGGGEGEIDWWESFGGHIGTSQLVNKTTMISTPYGGSTQQNYVIKQDVAQIGETDLTVMLHDHIYEIEKVPNRIRVWVDGTPLTEHVRGGTNGFGGQNMSTANWDRCFEVPSQRWYYRYTGQIGDDPDGQPTGNAGNVPANFVGSDMRLKKLAFWAYTP